MGYIDRAVDPQMLLTLEAGDDGRAAGFGRFREATRAVSAASSSFSPVPGSRVSPVQTRVTQENPRPIQADENAHFLLN